MKRWEERHHQSSPRGELDRDNADFGYRRMALERPLRLNFAVTDERLTRVREAKAFANLAASKKRKDAKAAHAEIEAEIAATLQEITK